LEHSILCVQATDVPRSDDENYLANKIYSFNKNILMKNNFSEQNYFPIWVAIDNGKPIFSSTIEKYCRDFVKDYKFAHGYEIRVVSINCYC
jgi:hypothetical protein